MLIIKSHEYSSSEAASAFRAGFPTESRDGQTISYGYNLADSDPQDPETVSKATGKNEIVKDKAQQKRMRGTGKLRFGAPFRNS